MDEFLLGIQSTGKKKCERGRIENWYVEWCFKDTLKAFDNFKNKKQKYTK